MALALAKAELAKVELSTANQAIIFVAEQDARAGDLEGRPLFVEAIVRRLVPERLGIRSALDIDPITAVAHGAAIYAESRQWNDEDESGEPGSGSYLRLRARRAMAGETGKLDPLALRGDVAAAAGDVTGVRQVIRALYALLPRSVATDGDVGARAGLRRQGIRAPAQADTKMGTPGGVPILSTGEAPA